MSNKDSLQSPKGTRDFYPNSMRVQRHIFDVWRRSCEAFGFQEFEGPTFEHLELFTKKSGDEIVSQLYNFEDKGGRQLALRPELTPTLARLVNQLGSSAKFPLRWFAIPRLFRYERAQRGRLREFYQLNMDIVGTESLWAEAELMAAIVHMLVSFGLKENDFSIRVSSRRMLAEVLTGLGLDDLQRNKVYGALDKKAKVAPEVFDNMLREAGLQESSQQELSRFFNCQNFSELKQLASSTFFGAAFESSVAELEDLFNKVSALNCKQYVSLDLSIVRGLAYYTGVVFEVYDLGENMRAIAGGGRYDKLLENLGGKPVSGVGFGMGDVVLQDLLESKNCSGERKPSADFFIADLVNNTEAVAALAQRLRQKGHQVLFSLDGGKLKKQLSFADESGAKKLLFMGSDRAGEGMIELKNLLSGEQSIVAIDSL